LPILPSMLRQLVIGATPAGRRDSASAKAAYEGAASIKHLSREPTPSPSFASVPSGPPRSCRAGHRHDEDSHLL